MSKSVRIRLKRVVTMFALVAMLATGMAISAQPAAAFGDHPVSFYCGNGLTEVWFYGQGDDGSYQEWYSGSVSQSTVVAPWTWQGRVYITYRVQGEGVTLFQTYGDVWTFWSGTFQINGPTDPCFN